MVNLYICRKVADLPLPGMPHLGSGIKCKYNVYNRITRSSGTSH